MSIKEGFGATGGIVMRTTEDQRQMVSIMEKRGLVDGQSHSMGNQRRTTQGLVQSELIWDYQASMEYV